MKPLKNFVRHKYLSLIVIFVFIVIFFAVLFLIKFVFINEYRLSPNAGLVTKRFADIFREKCEKSIDWQSCYAEEFGRLTKNYDLDLVFKTLELSKKLDFKVNDCHLLAHAISREEVAKSYPNWQPYAARIDPADCNGGYVHGIVEGLLATGSDFKLDKKGIKETCDVIGGSSGGEGEDSCGHAIGHMVLVDNLGEIPKSIQVCSTTEEPIRYNCYVGVFMEDILRLTLTAHNIAEAVPLTWENARGMESKCNLYSGEIQQACWREMAHFYTVLSSFDPQEVYSNCSRSSSGQLTQTCYSHAILLMALSAEFKDQSWTSICKPYQNVDEGYSACLSQVVNAYLYASINNSPKVVNFCQSLSSGSDQCCGILNARLEERKHEGVQCS